MGSDCSLSAAFFPSWERGRISPQRPRSPSSALIPSRFATVIAGKICKAVVAQQQEAHAHPLEHRAACPNPTTEDDDPGTQWMTLQSATRQCSFSASTQMGGRGSPSWKQLLPGPPVWTARRLGRHCLCPPAVCVVSMGAYLWSPYFFLFRNLAFALMSAGDKNYKQDCPSE